MFGAFEFPIHNYLAGDFIIKVTETRRFDPVTARKVLSDKEFKAILKTKPDAALTKAVLSPEVYKVSTRKRGCRKWSFTFPFYALYWY